MNARVNLGLALLLGASANAAEPPVRAQPAKPAPVVATPAARAPLKLQAGDVRKYMMPNEFRESIGAPDADKTTIIVQGDRPAAPLKSMQPVPVGLMTYPWIFMHPLQSWRALLPDLRAPPPGPPDVVPEREFRWGP